MTDKRWVRTYRRIFAILTLFAIAYQFWQRTAGASAINFFSFFTIQSNLFAAFVLLWTSGSGADAKASRVDYVRGAAVLYMSVTGVVYGLLLSGYQRELQTSLPWVNNILHRIMPLVLVADWLIVPPKTRLTLGKALIWLVYPLAFAAYSLIRGPLVGWYPYPFLNPDRVGGYSVVALYCLGIALGTYLFAWVIVTAGRHIQLVIK